MRELRHLTLFPALISFILLWPALLGLGVLAPTDIVAYDPLTGGFTPGERRPIADNPLLSDVVDSFVPWKLYMRSELEAGRFPLWNPYNLLGTHLHANLQSAFFSPFTLLWFLLPPLWGLGAVTFVKWTLGGLGMGLLLRRIGVGMIPAQFGSVAFMLSGPVVGWLQWPIADGLLWVLWLMWSALRWIDTGRPVWLVGLAFFVAAEITASHIETSFHSLLFLALFALAALVGSGETIRRKWGLMLGMSLAALTGLLMSAVQVLPFLSILTESYQWALRSGASTAHISAPPHTSLLWLSPNGWGWPDAFILPPGTNWIEGNPYVGTLPLLLAAWVLGDSLLGRRDDRKGDTLTRRIGAALHPRQPLFWLAMAVISAGMAYGVPPFSYLRLLPGFNTSLNPRLISVAGPCLIILAAMGLHRLITEQRSPLPKWWGLVLGTFALAGVPFFLGGLAIWWTPGEAKFEFARVWQMWGAALFCAGAALVLSRLLGWIGPRRFAALALGLVLLDMVRADLNFNPTANKTTFYPRNALTEYLARGGPTERVAIVGPYAGSNIPLAYRIPDVRSYDATHPNRAVRYVRMMSPESFRIRNIGYQIHLFLIEPSATLMAAVGIKHVAMPVNQLPIRWQEVPERGPVYTFEMQSHDFWVWRNNFARPFAYFASRFRTAETEEILERRMLALTLDRINEAQVFDPDGRFPPDVQGLHTGASITEAEAASVTLERYEPGSITVSVEAERKRLLVVNEQHTKDWRVTVNGAPAPLLRVNYLVQGVVVEPGRHTVQFIYDPPAFKLGIAASLGGVAGWLGLVGWSVVERRRRRRAAPVE
jgi:hypothetical protein